MSLRSINDISVIVYPRHGRDDYIVDRFLSVAHKNFVPYNDGEALEKILVSLKEEGIGTKDVLVLSDFQGRQFQKCPCTQNVVGCGYFVINTCFGCLYNCTYCYLNSYLNSFGIRQFIGTERITAQLQKLARTKFCRIGTGEFTDSLMFDEVTGIAETIIAATHSIPHVMVEFKTKSDNIGHLLAIKEKGNTVISWSLNTEKIVDLYEEGTASLTSRLTAAVKAVSAGYFVAFHFDPIVDYPGYEDEYLGLVSRLLQTVDPSRIVWISLGCFRFSPGFKEHVHAQFPGEKLTVSELFPSSDGKFRYLTQKRVALYRVIYERILQAQAGIPVYLCMEPLDVWNQVFGTAREHEKEWVHHLQKSITGAFMNGTRGILH